MTLDETIAAKMTRLTTAQRQALLAVIDQMVGEQPDASKALRDPRQSLAVDAQLTQEDFDQIRHGAWAGDDA